MHVAYDTIKEEDPNAFVWGPATVRVSNKQAGAKPDVYSYSYEYTKKTMEQGNFDVFSVHLYVWSIEEKQSAAQRIRRELDELGHTQVPIAVTESNQGTGVLGNGKECFAMTQEAQAQRLREIYYCLSDDVDHMVWWAARDIPYPACPDGLRKFGVYDWDLRPKISYYALADAGEMVS